MRPRRTLRRSLRRASATISVVVPVYQVAGYVRECLDSLLAQTHRALEIVVVDDGSTDGSGLIARAYADLDDRVRVIRTENRGLGAARNEGLRHVTGDYLAFADSDDVVPPTAYAALLRSLERSGSDLVTGSVARWEHDDLLEPPWMHRLHRPARHGITIGEHPELLGDVFAWNKLYRRSWWESSGLSWPEGIRYEDQPTTTAAFLVAGSIDVLPEVVYRWRIRHDGSSITQQRSSLADLRDRFETKRMSLRSVQVYVDSGGSPDLRDVFVDRVLAGDLHRYFAEIPGCDDAWWSMLVAGVREFWGDRSLTHSGLTPVHRLTGWLVEQDRRDEASAVMVYAAALGRPVDRVETPAGWRLDVPILDPATLDPAALAVRPSEL